MAITDRPDVRRLIIDKKWLRQRMAEKGDPYVPDPTLTAQKVREMMLADGIRPEDNAFSRDIIRQRYEDEE